MPDSIIKTVVEGALGSTATGEAEKNRRAIGSFFKYWNHYEPSNLKDIAKKAGVSIESLIEGDNLAALKALTENTDPIGLLAEKIQDPLIRLRAQAYTPISQKAKDAFTSAGFERLIWDMSAIDILHHTQVLLSATRSILSLYGFVQVASKWEAIRELSPGGPISSRMEFDHPQDLPTRIQMPYNLFTLREEFSRGTQQMLLSIHHRTARDVEEAQYFARTLIGNERLADSIPSISHSEIYSELRQRFGRSIRDPLTAAFNAGFIVDLGGRYAYHPRLLLEALASKILKPDTRYFFLKAVGMSTESHDPPDLEERLLKMHRQIIECDTGYAIPGSHPESPEPISKVKLSQGRGAMTLDVSMYLPILKCPNSVRIDGIMSLANLSNWKIGYATQSRLDHSIGVLAIARALCKRFHLKDSDRLKVEAYALIHDWGHLTGSHPAELYFRSKSGFDHEEFSLFLIDRYNECFSGIVEPEELKRMFRHEDPLHDIVDGPFGADRIYYTIVDPNMCGLESKYDPLDLISSLSFIDNRVVVDERPEEAFRFLNNRAQLYEDLYFSPVTQIADAYLRKLLHSAGINSHLQKIHIENKPGHNLCPGESADVEFWQFTDIMLQYVLSNHPDRDVSEPMRHLITAYHKSPHATAAVLKINGRRAAEKSVEIPDYRRLVMVNANPLVEETDSEEISRFQKKLSDPGMAAEFEKELSKMMELPQRHIIVAAVPNMQKLGTEYAPVRINRDVKSLFDLEPSYRNVFHERSERMACIRVAVHPQIYPYAIRFFEDCSLHNILRKVLR